MASPLEPHRKMAQASPPTTSWWAVWFLNARRSELTRSDAWPKGGPMLFTMFECLDEDHSWMFPLLCKLVVPLIWIELPKSTVLFSSRQIAEILASTTPMTRYCGQWTRKIQKTNMYDMWSWTHATYSTLAIVMCSMLPNLWLYRGSIKS
jgi:hypothetical protein